MQKGEKEARQKVENSSGDIETRQKGGNNSRKHQVSKQEGASRNGSSLGAFEF